MGDLDSIPGLGRSPGEGKGYPLQYSDLENSMVCIVHGGHKESDTTERLSLSFRINLEVLSSKFFEFGKDWCYFFFKCCLVLGFSLLGDFFITDSGSSLATSLFRFSIHDSVLLSFVSPGFCPFHIGYPIC